MDGDCRLEGFRVKASVVGIGGEGVALADLHAEFTAQLGFTIDAGAFAGIDRGIDQILPFLAKVISTAGGREVGNACSGDRANRDPGREVDDTFDCFHYHRRNLVPDNRSVAASVPNVRAATARIGASRRGGMRCGSI